MSDAVIDETQEDYVDSKGKPFYVGPDKLSLEELKKEISVYRGKLFFIDSDLSEDGLYTDTSLYLHRGFKVHTSGDFIIAGEIFVPNHCLTLLSDKRTWIIGPQIDSSALTIHSRFDIVGPLLILPIQNMQRPKDMPENLWNAFCQYYSK